MSLACRQTGASAEFMKRFICISTLLLFSSSMVGQHCGWDNCYVIILEVRDAGNGEVIDDLNIVLADSTGRPYQSDWNLENHTLVNIYQGTDTLKFGQNTMGPDSPASTSTEYTGPFYFAPNCYMLLVYGNNYPDFNKHGKDLILIRDTDGKENGGHYKDQKLRFSPQKITLMCRSTLIWYDPKYAEGVRIKVGLQHI